MNIKTILTHHQNSTLGLCISRIIAASIHPVRESACLRSPPTPYYTNDIEFKNNILKQHLGCKACSLPEFIESMNELLSEQRSEIEKAVPMYGEYRTVRHYSNLACDRIKWFKMSEISRFQLNRNLEWIARSLLRFSVDIEKYCLMDLR